MPQAYPENKMHDVQPPHHIIIQDVYKRQLLTSMESGGGACRTTAAAVASAKAAATAEMKKKRSKKMCIRDRYEVFAGQKAFDNLGTWLPNETVEAFRTYLIGIKGPLTLSLIHI